jgi:hypothetical protein
VSSRQLPGCAVRTWSQVRCTSSHTRRASLSSAIQLAAAAAEAASPLSARTCSSTSRSIHCGYTGSPCPGSAVVRTSGCSRFMGCPFVGNSHCSSSAGEPATGGTSPTRGCPVTRMWSSSVRCPWRLAARTGPDLPFVRRIDQRAIEAIELWSGAGRAHAADRPPSMWYRNRLLGSSPSATGKWIGQVSPEKGGNSPWYGQDVSH